MTLRILLILLLIPVAASAQRIIQREFNDMTGGCDNYGWNMKAEFAIAKAEPVQIRAAAKNEALVEMKLDVNNDVTLHPARAVTFAMPPERDRSGPATFSGLAAFKIPEAGVYRISSSDNNWMDVVRGTQRVASAAFEQQSACKILNKSVAYRLNAGDSLILQINGNPQPFTTVIVTKWAD